MAITTAGIGYDRAGPTHQLAVVLLHAGVADRRMWDSQWAALTAERDAIRIDLRGFGESATKPAATLDHVADVLNTLEELGVARCHLVGASFGAGVAVEVMLTRPALVESLLIASPGGALLSELTPDLQAFFDSEGAALARGDLDAAAVANVDAWVVGGDRDPSDVDSAVIAAVTRMQLRAFEIASSWNEIVETEMDPPALQRLAELHSPILLLVGAHDMDTIRHAADQLCRAMPGVRRVNWPDVAHLPSMERPADFQALLTDWITDND